MVGLGLASTLRRARRPLYICHDRADADALCTAYLLSAVAPGDITVGGAVRPDMDGVLGSFQIELADWEAVRDAPAYDLRVVVDSWGLDQVIPCPGEFILVDHHAAGLQQGSAALAPLAQTLFHAEAPSCTWMVYERLRAERVQVTRQMALAVLCGFLGDNALGSARPRELQAAARLMKKYDLTVAEARRSMDPITPVDPEPILDALRQGRVVRVGPYRLFETVVGSVHQSYAVRHSLLTFGFHGVVVWLQMNGHAAVHYSMASRFWRAGLMSRLQARLKARFPEAGHWRSGFSGVADPAAAAECLALMASEFEAAGP